jgi:TetR/AcrR family transcriptional regulator
LHHAPVARSNGGDQRRQEILDAGEREFAERGFEGARIEAIAAAVGVRKAALYYYFPSKAALYGAVVTRLVDLFEERVAPALDLPGRFEDRLERILSHVDELLGERPTLARLLVRHLVERPGCAGGEPVEASAPAAPAVHRLAGRFLLFYEAGVKAGAFRALAPQHVLASVLGTTFFYYAAEARRAAALGQLEPAAATASGERDEHTRRFVANGLLASAQRPAD